MYIIYMHAYYLHNIKLNTRDIKIQASKFVSPTDPCQGRDGQPSDAAHAGPQSVGDLILHHMQKATKSKQQRRQYEQQME